ncbi:MAG: AAA family ATPase [Oscillospiraceae bacterium]|nr:AAA family ATPase [Oscillospiraceae bacterium]
MFETGLEFIRTDFHLHTRKDKEFKYTDADDEFIKRYVQALKEANIGIGVITNHNKFDRDEYKAIRKAAKKQDIFILPGVELTIKEGANGIHALIVFNPDEWLEDCNNYIQTFLTAAFATIPNPENRNTKSVYDLKNVFEQLDAYGRDYFIIFAHVDQNSGLFSECKGGLLESLAGFVPFKNRVLGLQKSRTRDHLNQFERCCGYLPALVEGSDPKSIADIGKGDKCTYLKIGEFSYASVKFALQDHKDRVNETVPDNKHGYIESISFQGGKFDEQTIKFSRELNTLIGIRGSGKSSVLEAIRYVLGLSAQMDKEYKESLIKNVFGSGGKATLKVIDKHGKRYYVSRILGERINVLDENGNDLNINPINLFDGVQYFGQKDLSSSADHENGLLEKLISGRIGQPSNLDSCVNELVKTVERLLDVSKIPQQMTEVTTQQTELEHKLSIFEEKGVADKLKKQRGYATDTTKLDAVKNRIDAILRSVRNAYSENSIASNALDGYSSDFNKDIFEDVSAVLSFIDVQLAQIGSCIAEIEKQRSGMEDIISRLKERTDSLADEFAEIKREIKDETLDVDSFVKMSAELQKTKEKLKQLSEEASSKAKIEASFTKATRERNDALLTTYNAYKAETERINQNQTELRIEITFKGDREGFKSQLKNDFKGTGISDSKYQVICDTFTDYASIIEDWIICDGNKLKSIVSSSEYVKLEDKLRNQYEELLNRQVENKVDIYYHGKLLRQHSIGQRASALILFILTQDDNDIIFIDQPEDDLDNKVIYDEVITAIVQKKPYMQFIFATHNANIPVLGDSERVLVVEFQETKIDIAQGNIDLDSTHKQIVDIMEGGKEAFDKRQLIYTSWQ